METEFVVETRHLIFGAIALAIVVAIVIAAKIYHSGGTSYFTPEKMSLSSFQQQVDTLKRNDIAGAYALHNKSQNIWFFYSSPHVYREMDKLTRGKRRPYKIHLDIKNHKDFEVYIQPVESTGYTREDLCKALESQLAAGKTKYEW